jgi:hypothetical protein
MGGRRRLGGVLFGFGRERGWELWVSLRICGGDWKRRDMLLLGSG